MKKPTPRNSYVRSNYSSAPYRSWAGLERLQLPFLNFDKTAYRRRSSSLLLFYFGAGWAALIFNHMLKSF